MDNHGPANFLRTSDLARRTFVALQVPSEQVQALKLPSVRRAKFSTNASKLRTTGPVPRSWKFTPQQQSVIVRPNGHGAGSAFQNDGAQNRFKAVYDLKTTDEMRHERVQIQINRNYYDAANVLGMTFHRLCSMVGCPMRVVRARSRSTETGPRSWPFFF